MFGLVVSSKLKYKPSIRRMSRGTSEVDVDCIFKHWTNSAQEGCYIKPLLSVSVCLLIQTRLTHIMSVPPSFLVILTFFFLKATYQKAAVSQGP